MLDSGLGFGFLRHSTSSIHGVVRRNDGNKDFRVGWNNRIKPQPTTCGTIRPHSNNLNNIPVTNPHIGKHRLEPRWQAHTPIARHAASPELLDWLLDPSSLTRRLQQTCSGRFRVEPVSQAWQRPMLNEAQALGVLPHERCFVREVRLLCNDRPWVYARTVIPVRSLTGPRRRLSRLGKKPLGAVLFADPSMLRSHIEIAKLSAGQPLFTRATDTLSQRPSAIWGRRSAFFLNHQPLLVSEIFLPDICPQQS